MKKIYEQLKLFYLGYKENSTTPVVYENKNLTTHALIIGMTGSGKTGLGIGLIEEATIDNIPSFIIDPKGDMGNLLLTFPNQEPSDYEPWIDKDMLKDGQSVSEYAKKISSIWKDGIKNSDQDLQRIKALKDSGDFTIYTPASNAGVPVRLISSFKAPCEEILENNELLNVYINSIVFSILNLADVKNITQSSKEFVLLSNILLRTFRKKNNIDLESLIEKIVSPLFRKIGVFNLEDFYPKNERMELAMKLNSIVASPSFSSYLQGVELDITKMLFNDEGKAKVNIFSIAHLNDKQRMFFVTLLLNKIIEYMRNSQGSNRLKMLLYMDEIFGYFPPNQNPPSKLPMLTLLKQARAYGIGVVLSTQNPVDLDYKGLSNIGTWFIGRLQTSQDKQRVIDGLEGIKGSKYSKSQLLKLLSNIKKRHFLLKNIHEENLIVFSTRWVLSFLKGPLNKEQISTLMRDKKKMIIGLLNEPIITKSSLIVLDKKPINSLGIKESYSYYSNSNDYILAPFLRLEAKVNFVKTDKNIDEKKEICYFLPLNDDEIDWQNLQTLKLQNEGRKKPNSSFKPYTLQDLKSIEKEFQNYLYQNERLEIFYNKKLKLFSTVKDSKQDFITQVKDEFEELKNKKIEDLKQKFEKKQISLENKLNSALLKLDKEKGDVISKATTSAISIGASILGAIFGRNLFSRTNISNASSSIRQASGVMKERGDVKRAEENIDYLNSQIEELKNEFAKDLEELENEFSLENHPIQSVLIKPRRADIYNTKISLVWVEE